MKHLLMILDHFPPAFAPRMGYLCKYLNDMGWDAVALSTPHPNRETGFEFLENFAESYVLKEANYTESNLIKRIYNESYGIIKRRPYWSHADEKMYKKAMELMQTHKFDAILCSTASFFPLHCASRIAEECNLPILIDLRDIYEQEDNLLAHSILSKYLHKRQIAKRNIILSKANAVTTVSTWHKEHLSQFNPNTTLIFNGFDKDLFTFPQPVETDKFTITYTGSIREPGANGEHTQSPEMLFLVIAELLEQGILNQNSLIIRFFSDKESQSLVAQLASKYDLQFLVQQNDWVAATEIPQILAESNVLLLLQSESNTHGILTTKLFEYMASNREILCIPNSGGEIETILSDANAGCCIDFQPELISYIKFKYNEWQKNHFVEPHTNRTFVENFSREREAMQFVNILNQITKK